MNSVPHRPRTQYTNNKKLKKGALISINVVKELLLHPKGPIESPTYPLGQGPHV